MGRNIIPVLIAALSIGASAERQVAVENLLGTDQSGVVAISGGADLTLEDACYQAVQSAEVAINVVATPTATVSVSLDGEDREEEEWSVCFKLNGVNAADAQKPGPGNRFIKGASPPWGNGLPPIVTVHPGDPGRPRSDPECARNWEKLDREIAKKLSSVSASRQKRKEFDNHRPTLGVRGEECVTFSYAGGADHLPQYFNKPQTQPTPWAGSQPAPQWGQNNQPPQNGWNTPAQNQPRPTVAPPAPQWGQNNQPPQNGWNPPAQNQPRPTAAPPAPQWGQNSQPNQQAGQPWWASQGGQQPPQQQPQWSGNSPQPQPNQGAWQGNNQPQGYQSTVTIITVSAPPPGYASSSKGWW